MKKLIAAVTTAGLLIVGTAGVASAADSPSPQAPAHAQMGRGRLVAAGLKVAATTIGIAPKDLGAALKDGKSVAAVATANNVDPQKVVDAVVAAADKKVDEAVAAGKLDADKAATIKSKATDRVTKLVNGTLKAPALRRIKRGELRRHARSGAAKVAATTIGIDQKALADAVKGGQSVADVAKSHNVDPQKVIDAVVAAANQRIDAAVAAGKVKAERAATAKSKVVDRVTKLVNTTPRNRTAPATPAP